MRAPNVHTVRLPVTAEQVGALLDSLASADDRLWPAGRWPPMRLDRGLTIGSAGGHGPIRYRVTAYEPGRRVRFEFEAPRGFHGHHEFIVTPRGPRSTVLEHRLVARFTGSARLTWPLLYRPLHDALLEDGLARAARAVGPHATDGPGRAADDPIWGPRVRTLRRLAAWAGRVRGRRDRSRR